MRALGGLAMKFFSYFIIIYFNVSHLNIVYGFVLFAALFSLILIFVRHQTNTRAKQPVASEISASFTIYNSFLSGTQSLCSVSVRIVTPEKFAGASESGTETYTFAARRGRCLCDYKFSLRAKFTNEEKDGMGRMCCHKQHCTSFNRFAVVCGMKLAQKMRARRLAHNRIRVFHHLNWDWLREERTLQKYTLWLVRYGHFTVDFEWYWSTAIFITFLSCPLLMLLVGKCYWFVLALSMSNTNIFHFVCARAARNTTIEWNAKKTVELKAKNAVKLRRKHSHTPMSFHFRQRSKTNGFLSGVVQRNRNANAPTT